MMVIAMLLASPWVPDECVPFKVEMARGSLELFLDPTEARRSEVLERLEPSIRWLLAQAEKHPSDVWLNVCANDRREELEAIRKAGAAATADRLARARREIDPGKCFTKATPVPFLRESGSDLIRLPMSTPRSPECDGELLLELAITRDPKTIEHFEKFPTDGLWVDVRRWVHLGDQFQERDQRLRHALLEGGAVASFARRELLGSPDPRTWQPDDVAILIATARMLSSDREDPRVDEDPRIQESIVALLPMGLGNALSVLSKDSIKRRWLEVRAVRQRHFDHEFLLYESEWKAKNPPPVRESVSREEWKTWVSKMGNYVERRWGETDHAAPHPDLAKIREALEKRDSKLQ